MTEQTKNKPYYQDDRVTLYHADCRVGGVGVSCGWTEDDDGVWHTDCNNAFVFNTEGPTDNKFKVCPYCGKPLKENKPKE